MAAIKGVRSPVRTEPHPSAGWHLPHTPYLYLLVCILICSFIVSMLLLFWVYDCQTVFPGRGLQAVALIHPQVLQDEAVQHLGQVLEDEARVPAVLAQ